MNQKNNFEPTEVDVRREMIITAVDWICNRHEYTVDRNNMNPRSTSEKFDDGVMGEIASVAVMQHLSDRGRNVIAYDQIRTDQSKNSDPGWDLLVSLRKFDDWLSTTSDIKIKPEFAYSLSVKSSRIPLADNDDINLAIERRDFKILKNSLSIDSDITADYEVQVYFPLKVSAYVRNLSITLADIENKQVDDIVDKLKLMERYSKCYLSGAASRQKLINHSNRLPENKRTWPSIHSGYKKLMWSAPLKLGTTLKDISV